MYSIQIVRENLARIQPSLSFTLNPQRAEYCWAAQRHLDSLVCPPDQKGAVEIQPDLYLSRPLKKDEREFIQGERILCKYNFRYYCRYVWIESTLGAEPGQIVEPVRRFNPNIAQRMVLKVWAEEEAQYHPIMCMQDKGRQVGVTSLTQLAIGHRTQFYPHVNALVASSTETKTRKMADKMIFAYQRLPWWLAPSNVRGPLESKDLLIEFPDLNSSVTLQWGNQISGIARGETPRVSHLSEITEWTSDPFEVIDASLMRAFHPDSTSFMVWESTAKGMGERNYWFVKWDYFTAEWSKGTTPMRPLFVPYYVATDVWPTRTWARQHEHLLTTWEPEPLTRAHADHAQKYVQTNKLLRDELGPNWSMPKIQMLFWELERKQAKRDGKLNKFYEELASTPEESFQTTNQGVFDIDTIIELEAERDEPIAIYGVAGDNIPELWRPPAKFIDRSKNRIILKANLTGDHPVRYELVPLTLTDWQLIDPTNRLFIWEEPQASHAYHFGVDTSYGIGQDRSVISGLREATLTQPQAYQTCEYVNPNMNSMDLAPICMAIGLWYTVQVEGFLTQPKFSIECAGNGETTQLELRKWGWTSFHRWERYDNFKRLIQNKVGWFTNAWSRPMLVDRFNNAIRDRYVKLNSYWLINNELKTLAKDWDEAYARAEKGCFVAGTRVMTYNGLLVPIEIVNEKYKVLSHLGNSRKVSKSFVRYYDGQVHSIKVSGIPNTVRTTPNHPFWAIKRTRTQLGVLSKRKYRAPEWIRADRLKKGDWIAVPKRISLPSSFLTEDQLYVIGFWLAEGHLMRDKNGRLSGIGFTNTDRSYLERCAPVLREWFPTQIRKMNQFGKEKEVQTTYTIQARQRGNYKPCYTLNFRSRACGEWFSKTFSSLCYKKYISPEVYNYSNLLPLVAGFVDGDGSQRNNQDQDVTIHTTSEHLAWQLRQIMLDSGVWNTLRVGPMRNGRWHLCYQLNVKASYLHLFPQCKIKVPEKKLRRLVVEDERFFYSPVRMNIAEPFSGPVYNLEVEEDNTYVVEGMAVHNSHDDRYIALGIPYFVAHVWKTLFKGAEDVFEKAEALRRLSARIEEPQGAQMMTVLPHPDLTLSDYYSVNDYYTSLLQDIEESQDWY